MGIRISLLHASRQRPQLAYEAFSEWVGNCSDPSLIEYILGLDDNDPTIGEYVKTFKVLNGVKFIINSTDSRDVVRALNNAAKCISPTSELLICTGDDHGCFKGWDQELLKCLEGVNNFETPKFIGVNDGLREYGVLFVYYIANRAFYEKFGYVLYPEYDGVFADNDMDAVARRVGVIHAPHLKFQHKHWSLGMSKRDEISNKNDPRFNLQGWNRNLKIFQERSKRNFDL